MPDGIRTNGSYPPLSIHKHMISDIIHGRYTARVKVLEVRDSETYLLGQSCPVVVVSLRSNRCLRPTWTSVVE